jgi:hypothetical protein
MLFVISKNLWRDSFFVLFAFFWAACGVVNLPDIFPVLSPRVSKMVGVIYNMIDLPLIIVILYFNSTRHRMKRFILTGLTLVLTLEIVGIVLNGLVYDSLKYAMGTGILLIISIALWEVIRYLQEMEHSNRQTAKIFVYAAILFEYGTFTVIYIFDYYTETAKHYDTYLIYYISTLIAILIASCGYFRSRQSEEAVEMFMER